MTPETLARVRADASSAVPGAQRRLFRVDAASLRRGMFVAELDRPWADTPFLVQGFLIDSAIELKTLRRYCLHVSVDPERCVPEVAAAIRAWTVPAADAFADSGPLPDTTPFPDTGPFPDTAPFADTGSLALLAAGPHPAQPARGDASEPACATPPGAQAPGTAREQTPARSYRARADVRISPETRERFRSFVRGGSAADAATDRDVSLARRAFGWLRGLLPGAGEARGRTAGAAADRHAWLLAEVATVLPAHARPVLYADRNDPVALLPGARAAFARADEALAELAADIRGVRVPRLDKVREAVARMVASVVDNPDALMWVAQMREETRQPYQQGARVAVFLMALGRQLGLPQPMLQHLCAIGMLADIGKVRLPRALLDKPGMLNPAEFSIVREHVRLGLEALAAAGTLAPEVQTGIAQHHERLDGSGYPRGLKGEGISLWGRMAGIADCYAALSAPRAYAGALAPQDALMNLYQWADTSFHGPLVEQFVEAIGVFPVGSLVELTSGEVAVVVGRNRMRRLEPRVLLLTWSDKRMLPAPIGIDLAQQPPEAADAPLRVQRGLPPGAYGLALRDYFAEDAAAQVA